MIQDNKVEEEKFTILTIHHLSATGGTLISRCLAVMPEVVLLSEIHPHAIYGYFNYFDPIHQLTRYDLLTNEEIQQIFLKRIDFVVDKCRQNNKTLIIRDHCHSDFLRSHSNPQPSLLNLLKDKYQLKSLVTLRNPIDSWLSLIVAKWHKEVGTFDNYCDRYLKFLDTHQNHPYFLYEDFVQEPDLNLAKMCEYYGLDLNSNYKQEFFKIKLTGDSGRSSRKIGIRPRREYEQSFVKEVQQSINFREICQRLGYSEIV